MSDLKNLIDNAGRTQSQGIQFKRKPIEPVLQSPTVPSKKISNKGRLLTVGGGFVLLLALLIYSSVILYRHLKNDSSVNARALVAEVGKLVALPAGEIPTIATVTDPNALANQAFFKEAKVGDRVLIYSKSGKAILYRGSEHRVVAIAPLTFK